MAKTSTPKKKPKKLSPEERAKLNLQRRHKKQVRDVFVSLGFNRVAHASDVEITFNSATSDFDDVFILENVVVLTEYTIAKESEVSSHAKNKYAMYDQITKNKSNFLDYIRRDPLNIDGSIPTKYANHQIILVILYCPINTAKDDLKNLITQAVFMDYAVVRYFNLLTKTVKKSALYELLAFLGVNYNSFANRALHSGLSPREPFHGSVLPEAQSNFPKEYKVVSFYINPSALLSRAYVLRRDGWRDRDCVYQRMIIRKKLESVRKYLVESKRVFVNNIVVTLPSGTKIIDDKENTIDPVAITQTQPAIISIPTDFNSVGLIDGQHRVFSYYEGGAHEDLISGLREQQNLLVTGIVYPDGVSPEEKIRFEAGLFLEINSNQSNAKSELKQAINQIIRPFLADSIARDVLDKLNEGTGVLSKQFANHFFDATGLKTTSIVSYGLRPLVRPSSGSPLFKIWSDEAKETMVADEDDAARKRYVDFCVTAINIFFSAAKSHLPKDKWTSDRKILDRLVTPTVINGLIGSMRQAIDAGYNDFEFEKLRNKFSGLEKFNFTKYKSSQYTVMATDIYKKFFVTTS